MNKNGNADSGYKLPMSFYFTLLTIVFSVSGYVYTRTYYGIFGIEVKYFLSLEDYLRNSIDRIYELGLSLFITLILLFFITRSEKMQSGLISTVSKMRGKKFLNGFFSFCQT